MTLNGIMAINCVISPNSVASRVHFAKVLEDVVVKKFAFVISSRHEFLVVICERTDRQTHRSTDIQALIALSLLCTPLAGK